MSLKLIKPGFRIIHIYVCTRITIYAPETITSVYDMVFNVHIITSIIIPLPLRHSAKCEWAFRICKWHHQLSSRHYLIHFVNVQQLYYQFTYREYCGDRFHRNRLQLLACIHINGKVLHPCWWQNSFLCLNSSRL